MTGENAPLAVTSTPLGGRQATFGHARSPPVPFNPAPLLLGPLYGALRPTANDHDVVAHALNERFVELGGNHPVPYAEDTDDADEHDRTR